MMMLKVKNLTHSFLCNMAVRSWPMAHCKCLISLMPMVFRSPHSVAQVEYIMEFFHARFSSHVFPDDMNSDGELQLVISTH